MPATNPQKLLTLEELQAVVLSPSQETVLRKMASKNFFEMLIIKSDAAEDSVLAALFFASFAHDLPLACETGFLVHCRPERLRGQEVYVWIISDSPNQQLSTKLDNGSSVYVLSSQDLPRSGDPVALIWNDESVVNSGFYREWLSRLRDDDGMLIWSAPLIECDTQRALIERSRVLVRDLESREGVLVYHAS